MLLLDTYLNLYTSPNQSQQIMYFLKKYTNKTDIITDATAGIGGNSISFCKYLNDLPNNLNEKSWIIHAHGENSSKRNAVCLKVMKLWDYNTDHYAVY